MSEEETQELPEIDELNVQALEELEEKEGVQVVIHTNYRDRFAYVFIQDFTDGKRSYGYVIPRVNGASWVYLPSGDTYMKSEEEITKRLAKDARAVLQQEYDEEVHGTK
jgi:hypothetical protein